jgi:hypothetical protein
MQPNDKKRRMLVIAGVAAIVLLFGWLVWMLVKDTGKVKAEVVVVPSDATLTINGQAARAGTIAFTPGKYKLTVSRQHFGSVSKELDTSKVKPGVPFYLIAEPNTPEAESYMAQHPEEVALLETASGAEFTASQELLLEKYPYLPDFPYRAIDYRIDYEVDKNKNITLIATLNVVSPPDQTSAYQKEIDQYKAEVVEFLKSKGVDLNKVPVTYVIASDENV